MMSWDVNNNIVSFSIPMKKLLGDSIVVSHKSKGSKSIAIWIVLREKIFQIFAIDTLESILIK